MLSYFIHLLHHLLCWNMRRTGRTVTVKWYESSYDPPESDEEDYCPEPENTDNGSREFDYSDIDPDWDTTATLARVVAEYLKGEYATYETSSSPFRPGDWYTTEPEQDYRTGVTSEKSFHLYGFTVAEQYAIYRQVFGRKARIYAPRKWWPREVAKAQIRWAHAAL